LLAIFSIVDLPLYCQNTSYLPNIQHFSTEQGLSHREVLFIFHDRDNMTWISTPNGLNRFDGYHFKHFLGKRNGVDFRNIGRITQDDEGWLWLIQGQEVIFFHPQTEAVQTVVERFGANCILLNSMRPTWNLDDFPVDNDGRIYFVIDETNLIYTYHSSEGFRKKILPPRVPIKYKYFLSVSDNKELIFSLGNRKMVFNYDYAIHQLVLAPNSDSTYVVKEKTDYFNKFDLNENQKGIRWKNNVNDYFFFDKNGNFLTSIKGYRKSKMDHVFLDKQENYWISTKTGFYIVNIEANKFDFLEKPLFFKLTDVKDIIVDSLRMIVSVAQKGMVTYDFQTKEWKHISGSRWNRGMYSNDDGVWVTSAADQIIYYKNEVIEEFPYLNDLPNKSPTGFYTITPSPFFKDRLWIGAEGGLFRFNTRTKQFKQLKNKAIKDNAYRVQSIIPDKVNKDWLWLCTDEGLILFDEEKEAFIAHYHIEQNDEFFLPTQNVQHLYQDNQGIYWLATADAGIIRWDKKDNEFREFTINDGMPSNIIYSVYSDDFDNLWMSSDYGIIRMNKTTFAIKNYLTDAGTGQTEFNSMAHFEYRDKEGNQCLFFAGLKGVTSLNPKDFQKENQSVLPTLALLDYQQFSSEEKEVIDQTVSLKTNKQITLHPNDYIHRIEVGLLNYNDSDNNIYHYQLIRNGEKSDWKVQKSRLLQLGQLPYGTHQLTVKANTISNLESANELNFEIIVRRPFYLTWWFVLISVVSIIGATAYWYNRRNTKLKRRQIELETVVKERTEELQKDKAIIEAQSAGLKEIDAMKSRFFANVSHELRTPITLIQGPIQSVINSQELNNRNFTLLAKAKQNTRKLLQLVNEILDLTKLDGHKLELEETTVVLFTFLRQVVSNFQSIADSQSIGFIFNYHPPHSLQVNIDKNKIEKILNNLLSNAFKFTPKNGRIEFEVSDLGMKASDSLDNSGILITLKDNGRGIPSDDVPNVFNRFYQSSINKKAEGGLGIGLALSMEFVKLMKGKMWVESSIDIANHGSTFFFQFPKKEVLGMLSTEEQVLINKEPFVVDKVEQAEKPNESITARQSDNQTILLVEDNRDLRDYLSLILSPHYEVTMAENGKEALEKLAVGSSQSAEYSPPSLILSDVMMPIMDGFELLEKVKAHEQWGGLPFIMLTARAEMPTKLKALRIGVDDYLLKPFDEEELLTRIGNLIANYEERQAFLQTEPIVETTTSEESQLSATNQEWLEKVEKIILKEMNNSMFSNEYLAKLLFVSSNSLYRKIKSLTGLTPNKYIRLIRLQQAKLLLQQGKPVHITANEVGFQKVEYFSILFKKEFGKLPSEFLSSYSS
jgi:signal transduction histidine kinase/DNA-binding response OmpR family regulator/ligand-binding sensor domain-containing protein